MVSSTKLSDLVVDQYGQLSYKSDFGHSSKALLAVSWVPEEHERRLRAYVLLKSYLLNMSRFMLNTEKARNNRREYGDPEMIVETIVASVLGEETTIVVDGAGETTDPEEGTTDPTPTNPDADKLQEWFDAWDDDEHPMLAITEGETDAVGLGDGLWEITYDATKKRPRINVYDPGMYFPVLDTMEQSNADYPTRIHVAWDFEKWVTDGQGLRKPQKYTRKITWDLRTIDDGGTREHPWNEEAVTITCYKSDATWKFEDLGTRKADDFSADGAVWNTTIDGEGNEVEIRDLDLDLDFIPLVHLPNTIARKEHFGVSSLARVLQILDDLQAADTDLALSSRTTGTPPLWSKGQLVKTERGNGSDSKAVQTYGPGHVFEGAEVGIIDTSKSLDALLGYIEFLLRRLSANVQLPEASLGRIDPSKVDAGVIMSLSFGPLARMIKKMRLVRNEKYPILLKFVARTALKYEVLDGISSAVDLPTARLAFGRFMPLDRAAIIEMAAKLLDAKLISRVTAVRLLIEEAGLTIEDAAEEVERIQTEDFEGAGLLADATEDVNLAREYLGFEAEEAPLPPIELPPAPPPTPQPQPPGAEDDELQP